MFSGYGGILCQLIDNKNPGFNLPGFFLLSIAGQFAMLTVLLGKQGFQ